MYYTRTELSSMNNIITHYTDIPLRNYLPTPLETFVYMVLGLCIGIVLLCVFRQLGGKMFYEVGQSDKRKLSERWS
jgi:hypothetical protein